mgnify:CR=1 FL=1
MYIAATVAVRPRPSSTAISPKISPGPSVFSRISPCAAATTCTAGTASASAQGQVMISTQIAVISASWNVAPRAIQNNAVESAARCTIGA